MPTTVQAKATTLALVNLIYRPLIGAFFLYGENYLDNHIATPVDIYPLANTAKALLAETYKRCLIKIVKADIMNSTIPLNEFVDFDLTEWGCHAYLYGNIEVELSIASQSWLHENRRLIEALDVSPRVETKDIDN